MDQQLKTLRAGALVALLMVVASLALMPTAKAHDSYAENWQVWAYDDADDGRLTLQITFQLSSYSAGAWTERTLDDAPQFQLFRKGFGGVPGGEEPDCTRSTPGTIYSLKCKPRDHEGIEAVLAGWNARIVYNLTEGLTTHGHASAHWTPALHAVKSPLLIIEDGNATATDESLSTFEHETITVSTSFDSWIPILLWGGLFVWCLYIRGWLPAVVALMVLANSLMDPAMWSLVASILLWSGAIFLHSLIVNGIIPAPWGKLS